MRRRPRLRLGAMTRIQIAQDPTADAVLSGDPQYLTDEILFGEDSCGFVVSGDREALERLAEQIPLDIFGTVGGDALVLGEERWTLDELREAHGALAPLFP